jgi:predicted unusual protein kinase regulating ubiquinone biosynthesis (AarF/ABC1/UbiB family)
MRFREAILASVPNCYVPEVYLQYSTRRLLVSEWVDGVKITDLPPIEIQQMTALGAKCFLFQLLELGAFHGDPHPGECLPNLHAPHIAPEK